MNDPGTEPPVTQLYFPTGIAMDPSGRFAYVSNGNADLKYGGGSVQMIDVRRFECAIEFKRQQVGLTTAPLNPNCTDMAQMQSDTAAPWCQQDPLDPTIIDCDEEPFILRNATVKVGNFAGSIRLLRLNDADDTRRLFVAVRGDPSVTYMDVRFNSIKLDDPPATAALGALGCFTNPASLTARPTYKPGFGNINPPGCDIDHLLQLFNCRQGQTNGKNGTDDPSAGAGFPFCPSGTDDVGDQQIPTEPFGMKLDQNKPGDPAYAYLLISHLSTGQVSLVDGLKAQLVSTSQQFFPPTASGLRGAFMLAPKSPGDPTSTWYMTSNQSPLVATFHIASVHEIVPMATFSIQSTFALGSDLRDIIFDNGGQRAFLTENDPPTVLTLDTHTVAPASGAPNGSQPANVVTSAVDVCQTPSHMAIVRQTVAGADGTAPHVKTKLMVVCFLSSQVMIVDPDRPGVDDTIYSGLAGPNDIAFTDHDSQTGESFDEVPMGWWQHAWITNYSESTISVVETQPGSARENRVIARLGLPIDGPQGRTP